MSESPSSPTSSAAARRGIVRFVPPARWVAVLLAGAVVLALLAAYVDLPLAIYIHKTISADVDGAFNRIGQLGERGENYALCALLVYGLSLYATRRGWSEPWAGAYDRLARGGLLMVAVLALGGIVTGVLKHLVARARPSMFFEHGYYGLGAMFGGKHYTSFPSSHTLTAFGVGLTLAVVFPRCRWPVLAVSTLVAVSRLANLDHYASDVTAAALIALVVVVFLSPYFLDPARQWPKRLPWQWFKRAPR
ncbi:phosphatase PAP2 family protein [Achromobacter aloeverae]|uniref:Acid phosphatase n=1 Tax=Achromobacter aloeverae TaxID=1750518 RepID=A0A4Q1HDY7_9BURK|nr:phosphatase PAP2 family protein [Achromobacter aloeverae]RXN84371.1 acid phosphatase [Achromobacter aloeverae]